MIAALLYLQVHSLKNRLWSRLRRLQQPKYLAGAVVGGAYMYFFFLRHFFAGRSVGGGIPTGVSADLLGLYEVIGTVALFLIVFLAWIWPHDRTALAFTEAEVAFLFPAPVSRRTLLQFKLLKSQTAILFSAVFFTLMSRGLSQGRGWIHCLGWWLLLSSLNLHFLGASLARTRMAERGVSAWRARLVALTALAAVLASVFVWATRSLAAPGPEIFSSLSAAVGYARDALNAGVGRYLFWPFHLVVRPMLAPDARAFFTAAGPVLALLGAHYVWVIRSQAAFEEATVEASRKLAERVAAIRAGKRSPTRSSKRRKPPFRLRPTGAPSVALLWKNLISTGQTMSLRLWLTLLWIAVVGGFSLSGMVRESGVWPAVGCLALGLLGFSVLLGPQMLRQDLRLDLPMADVLKTYPLRGWQLVLGELLTPALLLSLAQWLLLILAVVLVDFPGVPNNPPLPLRVAIGVAAALILPWWNLISLLVLNGAALLFPAWVQLGPGAAPGIEVMGQRMIMMVGQLLATVFTLVPAALIFTLIFFGGKMAFGLHAAVPLAGAVTALALVVEVGLGVALVGRWFEQLDLSAEPAA